MSKANQPSVLLIYTGGTIGMVENPETGALEAFNFDQLIENVPELKRFTQILKTRFWAFIIAFLHWLTKAIN